MVNLSQIKKGARSFFDETIRKYPAVQLLLELLYIALLLVGIVLFLIIISRVYAYFNPPSPPRGNGWDMEACLWERQQLFKSLHITTYELNTLLDSLDKCSTNCSSPVPVPDPDARILPTDISLDTCLAERDDLYTALITSKDKVAPLLYELYDCYEDCGYELLPIVR